MKIRYHKSFEKSFSKLSKTVKVKTKNAIASFSDDPFTKKLRNHSLKGKMEGRRAFSVTGDVRVIFEEHESYTLVLMLDVGSHNQVY